MPLRSATFLMYFLGSSAGALVMPMVGIVCYIVLYNVFPQTTWWGKPLNFLGLRYSFICGLCLAVGTLLTLNRQPLGRRLIHPVEWLLLGMLVMVVLSTVTGTRWDHYTTRYMDKIIKIFLFVLIMTHVVTTRRRLWVVAFTFMLTALYLGYEAKIAPPGSFVKNRLNGIGGPDFRESSSLAVHLMAMLPFVAIMLQQRRWWLKILAFLAAGYAVNGVLLCQTRSAFIGGVIAGMIGVFYAPRRHRRWIAAIMVLGCIGGFILSDESFRHRMLTIFSSAEERDASSQERLDIWGGAWELIRQRPLGVGVGHFASQVGLLLERPELCGRDAHNTYVRCAGELGVPGLAVFLAIIAVSWKTLSGSVRYARSHLAEPEFFEWIVFANRLSLLAFLVSGMFVTRLYTEAFWWLLAMPVCISRAIENESRVQAQQETALLSELRKHGLITADGHLAPGVI